MFIAKPLLTEKKQPSLSNNIARPLPAIRVYEICHLIKPDPDNSLLIRLLLQLLDFLAKFRNFMTQHVQIGIFFRIASLV